MYSSLHVPLYPCIVWHVVNVTVTVEVMFVVVVVLVVVVVVVVVIVEEIVSGGSGCYLCMVVVIDDEFAVVITGSRCISSGCGDSGGSEGSITGNNSCSR